jgi:hypothetical protein
MALCATVLSVGEMTDVRHKWMSAFLVLASLVDHALTGKAHMCVHVQLATEETIAMMT